MSTVISEIENIGQRHVVEFENYCKVLTEHIDLSSPIYNSLYFTLAIDSCLLHMKLMRREIEEVCNRK